MIGPLNYLAGKGDERFLLEPHEYTEFEILYRQLTRKLSLEWNKESAQPITGSHAYILEKLAQEGPQKVSSLAEAIGITAGAVTGLSDKLAGYGYATRGRTEEDRRVVMLE
ncbi:MarR family transcriptional regulator, partial [Paenibacillus sp. HJGM_3]